MKHPVGIWRKRPRLCAVCHIPAKFGVQRAVIGVRINRDAKVLEVPHVVNTYYCAKHIADAERGES